MQKINVIRKWIILEFKTTFFINSSCSFIDESYSDSIDPAGDRKSKLLRPVSRDWPVIRRNYIVAGSSRGGCYETHPFPTVTDINLQYFVESIILRNCSSIFFSRIRSRRDIHTKLPSLSVESMHSTRAINTKAVLTTYRRILNKCL